MARLAEPTLSLGPDADALYSSGGTAEPRFGQPPKLAIAASSATILPRLRRLVTGGEVGKRAVAEQDPRRQGTTGAAA